MAYSAPKVTIDLDEYTDLQNKVKELEGRQEGDLNLEILKKLEKSLSKLFFSRGKSLSPTTNHIFEAVERYGKENGLLVTLFEDNMGNEVSHRIVFSIAKN